MNHIRTFDNEQKWHEQIEWKFFYIHLEMVTMSTESTGKCAMMREVLFIGNGREEMLELVVPLIGHVAWSDKETDELKRLYDKRRGQFSGMRWDGTHHRAAYRDRLYRKHFTANTEIMQWGLALKPWGVDPQRLFDLLRQDKS